MGLSVAPGGILFKRYGFLGKIIEVTLAGAKLGMNKGFFKFYFLTGTGVHTT